MKKVWMLGLIMILGLSMTSCDSKAEDKNADSGSLPTRDKIEEKYQWNLQDIYATDAAWENDFNYVEEHINDLKSYRGKLGESGKTLLACLQESELLERKMDNMYVYAYLTKDQDTKNSDSQARADRIAQLSSRFHQGRAFLWPEIQTIPEKTLMNWVEKVAGLDVYRHPFEDMIRTQKHILSEREEELLAMSGSVSREFGTAREALTMADIKFPKVKDGNGKMIELSPGRYYSLLLSQDADVRRGAFEGMYTTFDKFKNTSAALYRGSIKNDIFYAQARGYNSCLEMALSGDNIPVEVYDNLVATTHEYTEPLQRYMTLRKNILGLDELHLYDTSVPIVKKSDKKYTYEEAEEIIINALAVMGPQFQADAKTALNSRWIDVYETSGKRSGAYSWGSYESHPYMLLNFNGTLNSIFTMIHELGHSLHTYYTNSTQPYATSNYSLFVAEVASTFLENILMNYLLENSEDDTEKLALLDQWADNITGTLYTQVLFAEFERKAHEMAEEGVSLTEETLSKTYLELLKTFYGDALVVDDLYGVTWSRIGHFYRQFYVYKYATSISASTALSRKVINGEEGALENYMHFLHSGSSDYPINLLKGAGVDMSTPEPIAYTLDLFSDIVSQMEELLAAQAK